MKTLHEFIKEFRVRNNLTQQGFAERSGISKATVIRLEAGYDRELKPKLVKKIAEATGKTEIQIARMER